MKFRTEIQIPPFAEGLRIDHSRRGFCIGSCFAERIAERLTRAKMAVECNPTGVLYNPLSIAEAIRTPEIAARIARADWILITFGTAWVWEENGRVVANCGKRPAHLFTRRILTVSEIVERFAGLFAGRPEVVQPDFSVSDPPSEVAEGFRETRSSSGLRNCEAGGILRGKQVIFTLSPVRHLRDGLEQNSLSKAILRVATDGIIEAAKAREIADGAGQIADVQYFPAYEILNDDLRDYRFYGPDLIHPSAQAVDYIWEKFSAAAFSPATQKMLPEIEALVRATEHRPFEPNAQTHNEFRASMLARAREFAASHPEVDLGREIEYFS